MRKRASCSNKSRRYPHQVDGGGWLGVDTENLSGGYSGPGNISVFAC